MKPCDGKTKSRLNIAHKVSLEIKLMSIVIDNKKRFIHHVLRVLGLKSAHQDSVMAYQTYLQSKFKVCNITTSLI